LKVILPFFQFLEIIVYAADVFYAYFKEYIHYISGLNFFKNSKQCGIVIPISKKFRKVSSDNLPQREMDWS